MRERALPPPWASETCYNNSSRLSAVRALAMLHSSGHDVESFKGSLSFTQTSAKMPGQRLRVCKLIIPRWQNRSPYQYSFLLFSFFFSFSDFFISRELCPKNGQNKRKTICNISNNAVNILGKKGRNMYTFSHIHLKENMHEPRRASRFHSLKTILAFAAVSIFWVFYLILIVLEPSELYNKRNKIPK